MSRITLAHGSGGKEMQNLISNLFSNVVFSSSDVLGIDAMDDGGVFRWGDKYFVLSTDSYTVKPIFFPGGNIGKLAATGSINDVAVMGAKPLYATDGIIVEEGFDVPNLSQIVRSMLRVFRDNGVILISGDFKVMPKGELDGIVISTTVIGLVDGEPILDSGAKPGDKIIVLGTVGDHGAVITAYQYGINPEDEGLKSDCRSILPAMEIARSFGGVHAAKDPTRGGLATALNEIAEKSGVSLWVREEDIPVDDRVRSLMDLLGIDPLYLANEGNAVLIVKEDIAEDLVRKLRREGFERASIIGEVKKDQPGYVVLETIAGGLRIVEPLSGELTPRIC